MPAETYWDEVNRVQVRSVRNCSEIGYSTTSDMQYVIGPTRSGRLPINLLYAPAESETLVVSFHGSLQRSKYSLPRFEWRNTLARLKAGRLKFADTTLSLSKTMPLGWFAGTAEQNLTAEIATVVKQIAAFAGYSRIVLAGSSGGGYAAMAVSHRIPGSLAVSFSPQTRIADYAPWAHKAFVAAAFPQFGSIEEVERAAPLRVNLRDLYAERGQNFVRYVQNVNDAGHYTKHYLPFAHMLNIDSSGGADDTGTVCLVPEEMQLGHQPPSRGRFIRHIREAHQTAFGVTLQENSFP